MWEAFCLFKNHWLPPFDFQAERCNLKLLVQHITSVSLGLVFLDLLLSFIAKLFRFVMLLYNSETCKSYNSKCYITELKGGIIVPSLPSHDGPHFGHAPDPSSAETEVRVYK